MLLLVLLLLLAHLAAAENPTIIIIGGSSVPNPFPSHRDGTRLTETPETQMIVFSTAKATKSPAGAQRVPLEPVYVPVIASVCSASAVFLFCVLFCAWRRRKAEQAQALSIRARAVAWPIAT